MNDFILLLVLLILSALFSGSETALVSLSVGRVEALVKDGRAGAVTLFRLKTDPSAMLITILIGNNLVNIGASALATVMAVRWFGSVGPGLAVGVLTILILVFGEITPKSLATRYSERISLTVAPPLYGLMKVLYPLVWLFTRLTEWVHAKVGIDHDPIITESELISMVEHGEEEGTIESTERQIIERVFNLHDLKATDVMTPRGDVFSLDRTRVLADVLPGIVEGQYTRIPLYDERPDQIVRVLYLRDVLQTLSAGNTETPIDEISHRPLFVPGTQSLESLISLLLREQQHMAIVVDEHGLMRGVVTLEDLLEELVGEIYDESDVMPQSLVMLDEGQVLVDGHAELRVIEDFYQIDLPGKPTDTVNAWLLGHTDRIPSVGESFVLDNLRVTVREASETHVEQVALDLSAPPPSHDRPSVS